MARDTFAVAYSYYEVLNIGPDASQEEIHAAYRALVKKVHPDGGGTAGLFDYVRVAYDVLSDPDKRRAYDEQLRSGAAQPEEDAEGAEAAWPEDTAFIRVLSGRAFELFVVDVLARAGHRAKHRPYPYGVDAAITHPGGVTVIEVTGSTYPVGSAIVWTAHWALDHYQAASAIVITNSTFNGTARQEADRLGVELWDGDRLLAFLRREWEWTPPAPSSSEGQSSRSSHDWSSGSRNDDAYSRQSARDWPPPSAPAATAPGWERLQLYARRHPWLAALILVLVMSVALGAVSPRLELVDLIVVGAVVITLKRRPFR